MRVGSERCQFLFVTFRNICRNCFCEWHSDSSLCGFCNRPDNDSLHSSAQTHTAKSRCATHRRICYSPNHERCSHARIARRFPRGAAPGAARSGRSDCPAPRPGRTVSRTRRAPASRGGLRLPQPDPARSRPATSCGCIFSNPNAPRKSARAPNSRLAKRRPAGSGKRSSPLSWMILTQGNAFPDAAADSAREWSAVNLLGAADHGAAPPGRA